MNYKLSICIPTYNRAKFLPELLDSIVSQVSKESPVEICVSDNASEDNTKELIDTYKKIYPHIVYFCWPKNMGFDHNLLKAVEIASGEYCWLMGSDDTIVEGALRKVLNKLKFNKNDILLCERIECNINIKPLTQKKWLPNVVKDTVFDLKNEKDFIKYSFLAEGIGAFFSYLSSIICLKSKWMQINYDVSILTSGYSHVYMLLGFSKFDKFKLEYVADSFVYCRLDNDSFLIKEKDKVARILLDLKGYDLIAKLLFFTDPVKYNCILWALEKEIKKNMTLKYILFRKFFAAEETFVLLRFYCKHLFGGTHEIKFIIANIIYAFPLTRPFIKQLMLFIKKIKNKFRFYNKQYIYSHKNSTHTEH